jgi:hypothetical protein
MMGGMMWGMGLVWLIVSVVLVLVAAGISFFGEGRASAPMGCRPLTDGVETRRVVVIQKLGRMQ